MQLTSADFIQTNSGIDADTSVAVSLSSGTTAGNTVIIVFGCSVKVTAATGFETDKANPNIGDAGGAIAVFRKSNVSAGEGLSGSTDWTFTLPSAAGAKWYAMEISANLDLSEPLDASAITVDTAISNGNTLSTGTSPQNAGADTLALAIFASTALASSWSSYTNGFAEIHDVNDPVGRDLAIARKFITDTTGTFECTATLASSGSGNAAGMILIYRATETHIVAPVHFFAGYGWGTHGGINSHTTPSDNMLGSPLANVGTWNTSYSIKSAAARYGNYGLEVVQSASAVAVRHGNLRNSNLASVGMNVRVVSATGTVVVGFLSTDAGATIFGQLVYDSSATKFGIRCGTTGTVSYQSGTTALNTWVWLDWRLKVNSAVWHAEWTIETGTDTFTAQTDADLTGQVVGDGIGIFTAGSNSSQTMTAQFSELCMSTSYAGYPMTLHKSALLTVDTGGTPSVSGTSTNFSVFTANGTLAAWNAANARNAVDEVPPTVSAAADGVAQTAVAASDYMEFPMATYTLASDEVVAAVRMLAPAWGGTGAGSGTLGIRGHDGTTETTLIDTSTTYDAASPTALSSTEPRWQCAIWSSSNGWNQTELDAAALRVGFSTDATPDMGVHAIYLEIVIRKSMGFVVARLENNLAITTLQLNPYNSASVSYYTVNNDVTRSVQFRYWIGGVEQGPPATISPGGNQTITVQAASFGDVDRTTLEWV